MSRSVGCKHAASAYNKNKLDCTTGCARNDNIQTLSYPTTSLQTSSFSSYPSVLSHNTPPQTSRARSEHIHAHLQTSSVIRCQSSIRALGSFGCGGEAGFVVVSEAGV